MSSPILLDILVAAALLLAVWLGARKGLVLSLCSLVAVVVALIGSHFIADSLSPKLADVLEPRLTVSIQEVLDQKADELAGLQYDGALTALEEKGGVYQWAADALDEVIMNADLSQFTAQAAASAASAIAVRFAHSIILLVSFLLILMLWGIVSHALDLVARLPVLSSLNQLGGGIIGLAKGLILVWLVIWAVCDLIGLIPPDVLSQTHLLSVLAQYSPFHLMIV